MAQEQTIRTRRIPTPVTIVVPEESRISAKPRTLWRDVWDRLRQDRLALAGLVIIVLLVAMSVGAPLLAPHNPDTLFDAGLNNQGAPVPPGTAGFVLGADPSGRDLLSRLMYGGQASLFIGVVANAFAVIIGVTLGLVAAFFGGWVDTLIMRFTDIMMSLPIFLFALALVAVLSPGIGVIIFVIAFVSWTATCRIVHGQVLSLREKEFIEAARCLGIPTWRILLRHLLPHLVSPIIVYTTLGIATTVVFEANLSYIGLGVQPPTPDWGKMAGDGSGQLSFPWLVVFPGLAILLTVLGFNLLGDGLRDAFDPRQRR